MIKVRSRIYLWYTPWFHEMYIILKALLLKQYLFIIFKYLHRRTEADIKGRQLQICY